MGRFISRDPLGYVDGMNLYSYVKNNVLNLLDPLGLIKEWFLAKRKGHYFKKEYNWADENSIFSTVIGEGGSIQGAKVELVVSLPEIKEDCKYSGAWFRASADADYWISPLFGLFLTHDKADYSTKLLLRCDKNNGNLYIEEGEGNGSKGKSSYATALITSMIDARSSLVTILVEAGASASITSKEEFGLELPVKGGKFSIKVGSSVTKTGGWGKTHTKTLRYRCICCEDGKPCNT